MMKFARQISLRSLFALTVLAACVCSALMPAYRSRVAERNFIETWRDSETGVTAFDSYGNHVVEGTTSKHVVELQFPFGAENSVAKTLAMLSDSAHLKKVVFNDVEFSLVDLDNIKPLPSVTSLSLNGFSTVDPGHLRRLGQIFPRVSTLDLSLSCFSASDFSVVLAEFKIQTLIADDRCTTAETIRSIAQSNNVTVVELLVWLGPRSPQKNRD